MSRNRPKTYPREVSSIKVLVTVKIEGPVSGAGLMDSMSDRYADPPSRQTIYKKLRSMDNLGLIERKPVVDDVRKKEVTITDDGEDMLMRMMDDVSEAVRHGV